MEVTQRKTLSTNRRMNGRTNMACLYQNTSGAWPLQMLYHPAYLDGPCCCSQCWCGNIAFEFHGDPLDAKHCHCRQCQHLHGAPFQWAVIFPKVCVWKNARQNMWKITWSLLDFCPYGQEYEQQSPFLLHSETRGHSRCALQGPQHG